VRYLTDNNLITFITDWPIINQVFRLACGKERPQYRICRATF